MLVFLPGFSFMWSQNVDDIRTMSERVSKFAEHRNQTWKKTFATKNGGWLPHTNWTKNFQIRNDDLLTMPLHEDDMLHNDLKISPVSGGYRCMDHLFQNIFDHVTQLMKTSDLFNVDFIDQYFEVCCHRQITMQYERSFCSVMSVNLLVIHPRNLFSVEI